MKIKHIAVPLIATTILLGGCDKPFVQKSEKVITTDEGSVTVNDIMNKIGKEEVAKTAFGLAMYDILKAEYQNKIDKKAVQKTIEEEESHLGGKLQVKQMLESQGKTYDEFEQQKYLSAYQEKLIDDNIKTSDKELKESTRKVAHILIEKKKNETDEEFKERADKLYDEVKENPKKFNEIAKKESVDEGSKKDGGELGYVTKGQMVKPFEKAVFDSKENTITKPVKTDYGYHIIYIENMNDFNKNKKEIKKKFIENKIKGNPKVLVDIYKKLCEKHNLTYKDKQIEEIVNKDILNENALKSLNDQTEDSQTVAK